ncbi:GIY-YIG nuclease family protein [Gemelliphila palaticanis]|uniref:GIY-YIG nuclease family protein n=1 Tax=Gemelliphila palaticanis TaxID=81950 RepID=A0ABX2SYP8_9BACL|nr:GIY-YIG nuclease family protein [Gemella palaticanis]MBF0715218.1 GIY-YIG nuclease family protein [Gemella palaticanis]NYS47148.1 GIY-YIG nuclease family protein [Gemella palaticanis]
MEYNKFYTYILICNDNTLYTGYTNNLEKRLKTHNSGKGAKYTRSRLPVKILYYETFETKSLAIKKEIQIKKLKKINKISYINNSIDKDKKKVIDNINKNI